MKLALIGYGKMNKLVEEQALRRGHEIGLQLTSKTNIDGAGLSAEALSGIDVCVDFTEPVSVLTNIRRVVAAGLPIVVGTTGWLGNLEEIKAFVQAHNGALVYGSNFSLGMNIFFRIVEAAAALFATSDTSDSYDAFMIEQHHKLKKDAPSGTALTLQNILTEHLPRAREISSVRAGYIPGTHEISFDSEADTITLSHIARSRNGFAAGAIQAVEWIVNKQGVYEFPEVIFGK